MPNNEIKTNDQMRNNHCYLVSSFELRLLSSFVIRHSSFILTQPRDIAMPALDYDDEHDC